MTPSDLDRLEAGKPKDMPIIFSALMVRALLDGRKTMTRRLAWQKPRVAMQIGDGPIEPIMVESAWQFVKPGDRLWVRETWARNADQVSDDRMDSRLVYAADGPGRALDNGSEKPWRSPIHMPRRASRLTLTVTAAKIERLLLISQDDAVAEGCFRVGERLASEQLRDLWLSLHGPGSWEQNPEVVAISFTVRKGNIDKEAA